MGISSKGVLPQHISSYQLSVEPGSALAGLVDRGQWFEAPEELCSRQYDILCERLRGAGYHHYEISNFAQPGYEAVHNSAYWKHQPYVGLGPGAHSYLYPAVRQWNESNLGSYLMASHNGGFSSVQGSETLTPEQLIMERIMLGLRTSAGLPEEFLRSSCDNEQIDEALRVENLVRMPGGMVRIPENRLNFLPLGIPPPISSII